MTAPLGQRLRQESEDAALVDAAIRRHTDELLNLSRHRPHPGEMFPSHQFAQAQWHLLRIHALREAPLDIAAAHLREDTLKALGATASRKEPGR